MYNPKPNLIESVY